MTRDNNLKLLWLWEKASFSLESIKSEIISDLNFDKYVVETFLGNIFIVPFICTLHKMRKFISGYIFKIKEVYYMEQRKKLEFLYLYKINYKVKRRQLLKILPVEILSLNSSLEVPLYESSSLMPSQTYIAQCFS